VGAGGGGGMRRRVVGEGRAAAGGEGSTGGRTASLGEGSRHGNGYPLPETPWNFALLGIGLGQFLFFHYPYLQTHVFLKTRLKIIIAYKYVS
jgi:hypothetical protein